MLLPSNRHHILSNVTHLQRDIIDAALSKKQARKSRKAKSTSSWEASWANKLSRQAGPPYIHFGQDHSFVYLWMNINKGLCCCTHKNFQVPTKCSNLQALYSGPASTPTAFLLWNWQLANCLPINSLLCFIWCICRDGTAFRHKLNKRMNNIMCPPDPWQRFSSLQETSCPLASSLGLTDLNALLNCLRAARQVGQW